MFLAIIFPLQLLESPTNIRPLAFLYEITITLSYLLTLNQMAAPIETAASYFLHRDLATTECCWWP